MRINIDLGKIFSLKFKRKGKAMTEITADEF